MSTYLAEIIEALFEHWCRANCKGCGGSGWSNKPYQEGFGSYDMICDDCGGQSALADRSYFVCR